MTVLPSLILAHSLPFLIGALLIYFGFRRARTEAAKLESPTAWSYINNASGYWIVAAVIIVYGFIDLLGSIQKYFT